MRDGEVKGRSKGGQREGRHARASWCLSAVGPFEPRERKRIFFQLPYCVQINSQLVRVCKVCACACQSHRVSTLMSVEAAATQQPVSLLLVLHFKLSLSHRHHRLHRLRLHLHHRHRLHLLHHHHRLHLHHHQLCLLRVPFVFTNTQFPFKMVCPPPSFPRRSPPTDCTVETCARAPAVAFDLMIQFLCETRALQMQRCSFSTSV